MFIDGSDWKDSTVGASQDNFGDAVASCCSPISATRNRSRGKKVQQRFAYDPKPAEPASGRRSKMPASFGGACWLVYQVKHHWPPLPPGLSKRLNTLNRLSPSPGSNCT